MFMQTDEEPQFVKVHYLEQVWRKDKCTRVKNVEKCLTITLSFVRNGDSIRIKTSNCLKTDYFNQKEELFLALIKCPECGKEISDQASQCIYCGFPLTKLSDDTDSGVIQNNVETKSGTLVIYGYTGWFLVKPKLKIYINSKYIGDVSYKSRTQEIPITEPSKVEIKCFIRCTEVHVFPNSRTEIYTQLDRITGDIIAEAVRY